MNVPAVSIPFSFDEPRWLWVCLLIPALIVVSMRSLAGLELPRRIAAIVVRSAVILVIAACLAGVEYVLRNTDLSVIFLLDRSHSVQNLQEFQEKYLKDVGETAPKDDRFGVIDFARSAYLQQKPMAGGYHLERLPQMPNIDRTDIASAMRLAMAIFPFDAAKRIVLISDGNDNLGDVLTEARRAKADGIPVDVVPLWYRHRNEVYVDRVIAPSFAEEGEQVPLRIVVSTQEPTTGALAIYHNGKLYGEPERVNLKAGSNTFTAKVPLTEGGPQRYEVFFEPDDKEADAVSINNSATAFSIVSGASSVLLLSMDLHIDQELVDALRKERVLVTARRVDELEDFDLLRMSSHSAIILANVPAGAFTDDQIRDLAVYVRDHGGGLIMLGGDESFGAGGWIGTEVEKVLPVSLEIKHKRVLPRGALALIMHSCEIPRGNYYGKEMAKKCIDTVASQDYVGVLAYSFSPGGNSWEVPLDLATNKPAIKAKIDRMQIGDMPDYASTMSMAYDALVTGKGRDAAQKHVIILSDGDAAPPSDALLTKYKEAGITCSTIGIGWGMHVMTQTLQDVATKTGGRFYDAKNPRELPQIFMKESKVVRRPLIVEDDFQPQIIRAQSDLLTGLDPGDGVPPLGGMVLTSPRDDAPHAEVAMVRQTDDGADPVLAYWQCELGKVVAFTSGWWPQWGQRWTEWDRYARFWAQLVRWTMQQDPQANFDTATKIEGNRARIVIDALDAEGRFLNNLSLMANVTGPDGEMIKVAMVQQGPGHYEAEFEADKAGAYLASIQDLGGRMKGLIRTGLSVPFSPEYRELKTNEATLRELVRITGGRWLDPKVPAAEHDVFSHDLPPTEARRPAWEWVLAWLLLPLFLLDVAVRRLASWLALSIVVELLLLVVMLFGLGQVYAGTWGIVGSLILAELVGWSIRFRYIRPLFEFLTHRETALSRTAERSEAALDQLRGASERTREDLRDRARLQRIPQHEIGQVMPEVARRRFDVGDEKSAPTTDISDSLGGAKAGEQYKEKQRPPAPSGGTGEGEQDATARLLEAKRRARKGLDDQKE